MNDITPLFAVEAKQLFQSDTADEALVLCTEGIAQYPDYPMGYAMLAQILARTGNTKKAQTTINEALSRFPNHLTLLSARKAVEEIEQKLMPEGDVEVVEENIDESTEEAEESKIIEASPPEAEQTENHISEPIEELSSELSEKEATNEETTEKVEEEVIETRAKESDLEHSLEEVQQETIPVDSEEKIKEESESIEDEFDFSSQDIAIIPGLEHYETFYSDPQSRSNSQEMIIDSDFTSKLQGIKLTAGKLADGIGLEDHFVPMVSFPLFTEINLEAAIDSEPDLESLAKKLENIQIPIIEKKESMGMNSDTEPALITETMAKVYEKQGSYEAAIKIYLSLAEKHPEKENYFQNKIDILQSENESAVNS